MSESRAAPRRWRRFGWAVVAAILIASIVQGGLHAWPHRRRGPRQILQVVTVASATQGDMPIAMWELGAVTPLATVTVLPQLSGYLSAVDYREGQEIRKGQVLAQIDPRPYQIAKEQAEAQLVKDRAALAQALSDLDRYAQLAARKSIADQTYEDQKFTVEQDEATIRSDRAAIAQYDLDLEYCRITAPVSGRVALRLVDPGNYVTASSSTGIVVITQMKPTTVEVTVPQYALSNALQRYGVGARMRVQVYSADNDKLIASGWVYAMSNQMATATGTVTLRAMLPNDDGALYPKEFVNVRLTVNTLHDIVLVPTAAVQSNAEGDFVYVVNPNHTISAHKVTSGASDGPDTAIDSGLSAGQIVVTDGMDRLHDGATIRIAGAAFTGGQPFAARPWAGRRARPAFGASHAFPGGRWHGHRAGASEPAADAQ